MSTDSDGPTAKRITLLYDDDEEQWLARDEARKVTARSSTREGALEALDDAVVRATTGDGEVIVGSDDPFFTAPSFSSGQSDVSQNVDEYLTGDRSRGDAVPDEDS
jgi:hypothetical protein